MTKSQKKDAVSAQLVLLDTEHSGRDEMNLAGLPFALLQAASKNGQLFIRHEWPRQLANGRTVQASWKVAGDAEFGLPGPNEEMLYLVLLQLTREAAEKSLDGQWPQKVFFSRNAVLEALGWSNGAREYATLHAAFARLQAVTIQAEHSFYDARTKSPFTSINFGILNDTALVDERNSTKADGAMSWFEWNSVLHSSFIAGNLRSLALDFTRSLDSPTSRRLFRFLDMMRHASTPARREFSIGILKLRDRLGMTEYKYASKVKEKLAKAHTELIERGYLHGVEYSKGSTGAETVLYRFGFVETVRDIPAALEGAKKSSKAVKKGRVGMTIDTTPAPVAISVGGASLQTLERARRCHALFLALPEKEQERLRSIARTTTPSIFWDRLESPDSPMALTLWDLVEEVESD